MTRYIVAIRSGVKERARDAQTVTCALDRMGPSGADACQIHERLRERIRAGKALKPLTIRDDGQGVAQEAESGLKGID